MSKLKYFNGASLKWSTEDVHRIADQVDIKLSNEDAEAILYDALSGNEYIMGIIHNEIKDFILHREE